MDLGGDGGGTPPSPFSYTPVVLSGSPAQVDVCAGVDRVGACSQDLGTMSGGREAEKAACRKNLPADDQLTIFLQILASLYLKASLLRTLRI